MELWVLGQQKTPYFYGAFCFNTCLLISDKPEVNYLSIPAIRLQNGKCEIRHILRDELELPKEV